jgi:hypothetical protein
MAGIKCIPVCLCGLRLPSSWGILSPDPLGSSLRSALVTFTGAAFVSPRLLSWGIPPDPPGSLRSGPRMRSYARQRIWRLLEVWIQTNSRAKRAGGIRERSISFLVLTWREPSYEMHLRTIGPYNAAVAHTKEKEVQMNRRRVSRT